MKGIEEHITALMETKDFHALTPAEREMVLTHISAQEYTQRRKVLLQSARLFEEESTHLAPDPQILANLRSAMASRKQHRSALDIVRSVIDVRIPLYQAGLAMLSVVLFAWWFRDAPRTEYIETERVVYQHKIDTVTLTKEVPVERIVRVVEHVKEPMMFNAQTTDAVQGGIVPVNQTVELDQVQRSFGNTALARNELAQFLVGVN